MTQIIKKSGQEWKEALNLADIPDETLLALLEAASDESLLAQENPHQVHPTEFLMAAIPNDITPMLKEALLAQSLGQALKMARQTSGMTLADVSEQLGVSRGRAGQLEIAGANLVGHPESPLGLSEQSECGKMVCPTSLEAARPVRCPQLGQEALGRFSPKLENL
jgi:hypothetical protein